MKKILIALLVLALVVGGGFAWGWLTAKQKTSPEVTVTAHGLLTHIQDQNFLVTKTLFIDEQVSLTLAESSGIKRLFTADDLDASGIVRVDVGVDLYSLSEEDIVIDHERKQITVFIPQAEILDASIFGDIAVETQKGIFTSIEDLFTGDDSEAYNRASRELVAAATSQAMAQANIYDEAQVNAIQLITLVARGVAPEYTVNITSNEHGV